MDLKAIDQIFELKRGSLWVRVPGTPVWHNKPPYQMAPVVAQWLKDHKVRYTVSEVGLHGIIHIHDRKAAVLFKLSWM